MKRLFLALLVVAIVAAAPLGRAAESDQEVAARKRALDIAGAFSNDGFKLRDGHWTGALTPGRPQLVEVNLYAGNEYWFVLAGTPEARKVAVSVYDESGKPLSSEPFADKGSAAAGFAPKMSGLYYLKIETIEGEPATFCLLYSYK